MSEEFARTLVKNMNEEISMTINLQVKQALKIYRDMIIKTMEDMGHTL